MAVDMANGKIKASVWTLILCSAIAVMISLLFLGAVDEPALEGSVIGDFSDLGAEVIAFDETEDGLWLVTGDENKTHILKLDKSTGEILSRNEMNYSARKAVPIGSSLFIFSEDENSTTLREFSGELETESEADYPVSIGELEFYTVTSDGICFVRMDTRNVLEFISAEGEAESLSFEGEIEFLEAAGDGTIFLYVDNSLFLIKDEALIELDYSVCPVKLLNSTHFIDSNNYLCELKDNTVNLLLECSASYNCELTAMSADNEGIILAQSTDKLSLFSFDGETKGSLTVDGKLLGVTPSGALFERNSSLCFVPHDFASPEPELIHEPDPYSGEGWIVEPKLRVIEVEKGFDAEELIKVFHPYAETVHTEENTEIISGKLATGMTIDEYDIVVRGDCSGNGEVNSTDIKLLQGVFLGTEELTGVHRIAADVDADGELTTADLVWMDKLRRGEAPPNMDYSAG